MAKNIGSVYDRVNILVNKNQSGRVFTPDQFNVDIQYVLQTYLNTTYGLKEQPDSPQYFERTQKISDDFPFLTVYLGDPTTPLLPIDNNGRAVRPSNYWHLVGAIYKDVVSGGCSATTPQYRKVSFVNKEQFLSRQTSSIMMPTYKNPIGMVYDNYFMLKPNDLGYVSMIYLRYPLTPFYDYDIINDQEVFLPAGQVHVNSSVLPAGTPSRTQDFELPFDCWDGVISILLKEYGIREREDFLYQTGQQRQETGK